MSDITVDDIAKLTQEELFELIKKAYNRINMLEYSYDPLLNKAKSRRAAQVERAKVPAAIQWLDTLLSYATADTHKTFDVWKLEQLKEHQALLEQIEAKSMELAAVSTNDPYLDSKNPTYKNLKRELDDLMRNMDIKFFVLEKARIEKARLEQRQQELEKAS